MSSQPPWMEDDRPPWEVDDLAEPENPLVALRGQITGPAERNAMRRSLTGPVEDAAQRRSVAAEGRAAAVAADPRMSAAYDVAPEAAAFAGATPLMLAGAQSVPVGKAAAMRTLYGLLGTAAGGTGGKLVGQGLEAAGFPSGTSKVTGTLGGLVGGGIGAVRGREALAAAAELAPGSTSGRLLKLLAGDTAKKKGRDVARDVAGARTKAGIAKALSPEKQARLDASRATRAAKAEEAVSAARGGTTEQVSGGTAGNSGITEILDQLDQWKNIQKFSDGQMVSSLRNVYGVPEAYGRKLVAMLQ